MIPIIGIPVGERNDSEPAEYGARITYCEALTGAGGVPVLVPPLDLDMLPDIAARLDGLLLAGGGDVAPDRYGAERGPRVFGVDEERDELEIGLASLFLEQGKPILAICRGIQVLNVAAGGTLIQHIPDAVPGAARHRTPRHYAPHHLAHEVRLLPGSLLEGIYGEGATPAVNSRHHQAVDAVAAGLRATAWAPDGVIEGLETAASSAFVIGVQWHPEDLAPRDEATRRLFARFVASCRPKRGRGGTRGG